MAASRGLRPVVSSWSMSNRRRWVTSGFIVVASFVGEPRAHKVPNVKPVARHADVRETVRPLPATRPFIKYSIPRVVVARRANRLPELALVHPPRITTRSTIGQQDFVVASTPVRAVVDPTVKIVRIVQHKVFSDIVRAFVQTPRPIDAAYVTAAFVRTQSPVVRSAIGRVPFKDVSPSTRPVVALVRVRGPSVDSLDGIALPRLAVIVALKNFARPVRVLTKARLPYVDSLDGIALPRIAAVTVRKTVRPLTVFTRTRAPQIDSFDGVALPHMVVAIPALRRPRARVALVQTIKAPVVRSIARLQYALGVRSVTVLRGLVVTDTSVMRYLLKDTSAVRNIAVDTSGVRYIARDTSAPRYAAQNTSAPRYTVKATK